MADLTNAKALLRQVSADILANNYPAALQNAEAALALLLAVPDSSIGGAAQAELEMDRQQAQNFVDFLQKKANAQAGSLAIQRTAVVYQREGSRVSGYDC